MKFKMLLLFLFGTLMLYLSMPLAQDTEEDKGAENLRIQAGRMNNVHFPHHRHQAALGDCAVCHDLFPKQAHSIRKLKDQGKLRKKQGFQQKLLVIMVQI